MLKTKLTQSKILQLSVLAFLFMAVFSVSSLEASKVYTWKDASGVIHYSDKPVSKAKSLKAVQIKAARPNPSEVNPEEESSNTPSENELKRERLGAECSKARKNLVTLASGKTIRRTNAKGEQVLLDTAGLRAEVQKNQNFINSSCRDEKNSSAVTTVNNEEQTGASESPQ